MAVGKKKKKKLKVDPNGIGFVKSTFNNTLVTLTDKYGNAISWASSGMVGFKGSRKNTPFAASQAAEKAANAKEQLNQQISATVGTNVTSARFFEVPDKFEIKFVRMNPQASEGSVLSSSNMHFKVADSVCTNMAVNYTPDGQYTSFKDITAIGGAISVPVIQIDMAFTETKLLSQADLMAGF